MKKTKILCHLILLLCSNALFQMVSAQDDTDSSEGNLDHLAGLIIYSSDIERSINFYTEVMGLKTVGRVEREGELVEILLSASGKFLQGMMLTLQPSKDRPDPTEQSLANFGTIIFMTGSNEAMAERLRAAGNEVTVRDPQHLYTNDPDGYRLMIYQLDPSLLNAQQ